MRRSVQILFLAIFTLFFFLNAYGEKSNVAVDLFLRIDPLIAITNSLASRQFHYNLLLSLVVVVSAILAGRFFCGYICPLGTLFDLAGGKDKGKRYALRNGKYYILIFVVVSALLSLNLTHLFDPIAFLTRVYTFFLYPFTIFFANISLDIVRPLAEYCNLLYLSHKYYNQPVFSLNIITILLLVALFFLNVLSHRFWCRNLCPLGGLLALLSRFGMVKRQVDKNCNSCMKCHEKCPMGAIQDQPQKTVEEECIECNTCSRICPQSAVSFKVSAPRFSRVHSQINLTKRWFFFSAGASALAVLSHRIDPVSKIASGRLIRPPGSLPENLFLKLCIRCGQCMKVCPTNTLQPCFFESGIEGIWSPRLFARLAGCDQTCNLCGTVCPTDAIRSLSLEEKKHAKIGTAFIDRDRCLVWEQDRLCFICDEQCPYNAIVYRWKDGFRRPFVIDNKCNGCGFCEQACPLQGESAIQVTAQNEIRLESGSYVRKAEELKLKLKEDPGDDRFFLNNKKTGKEAINTKIPEGFILK
jgi:polyferredoxin